MALILKVQEVVKESGTKHPKVLAEILRNMAAFRCEKTYGEYAPSLDFRNQSSRHVVGEALFGLWHYCVKRELPLLNFLVVHKGDGLPGIGVESWYEDHFKTMKLYDAYCALHSQLAELMLKNAVILIED